MGFRFRFQFLFQFLFLFWFLVLGSGLAAAQPNERVLVIPFENPTREPRILWIGEASAVLLADDLNAFGRRAYTREERLDAFQRLQVPPVATLSHATVIRLGQVVGATHVVIGSFRLTGGMISVRTQIIRLDTGRMEHEFVEAGPLEDLFAIFGRVSRRLAGRSASDALPPRPALPVFENYIKGLIATSTAAKIGYLEAAIKLDPGFDRARLALWNVQYDDANGQAALVAAAAVAETSPMYAPARFSVALSLIQLNRLDDAFATLRTLADRAPSATLMNNIGVIQLRRPVTPETGRATYYFNQALKLDEDDQDYYFNLGYAYWAEKDAASATFWLREAVRRDPADGEAHAVLAAALQATGAAAEAARERELATQLSSTYAEWAKETGYSGWRGYPTQARAAQAVVGGLHAPQNRQRDSDYGPARAKGARGFPSRSRAAVVRAGQQQRSRHRAVSGDLFVAVRGRGSPAARSHPSENGRDCGGDRRVQDRAVESGIGRGAYRAGPGLSPGQGYGRRPFGARARVVARSEFLRSQGVTR